MLKRGIMRKRRNKYNKITISIISFLCIFIVGYFCMALYFLNHFYFGSEINYISVSGKTVNEAEEEISSQLQNYKLNIEEKDGKTEQISGEDIGLKFNKELQVQNLKDKQNAFVWIFSIFDTKDYEINEEITYDKALLKEKLDKLSCVNRSSIIEPQNPSFKYTDGGYIIVDEVNGNKIDKDALYEKVARTIQMGETSINLEAENCYIKPQYTSKSKKIIDTKNILNKYAGAKITYIFGDRKETVDGSIISNWIKIDDKYEVTIDEGKVKNYFASLANIYNTAGKTRSFITTSGKTIQVSGGDYGWTIDTSKVSKELISDIKAGKIEEKEPTYLQKGVSYGSNDIGNSYVEIDLSKQHLWCYKNGTLVAEGDVVTGNISTNHGTPAGVYSIKYKDKMATLKGADYSVDVTFWMPFNGGIGIHDASWRSVFGGNIYRTNGSHGCVNTPYNVAKAVFDNISAGTPVVCYY